MKASKFLSSMAARFGGVRFGGVVWSRVYIMAGDESFELGLASDGHVKWRLSKEEKNRPVSTLKHKSPGVDLKT
jgi:hypothetical protein